MERGDSKGMFPPTSIISSSQHSGDAVAFLPHHKKLSLLLLMLTLLCGCGTPSTAHVASSNHAQGNANSSSLEKEPAPNARDTVVEVSRIADAAFASGAAWVIPTDGKCLHRTRDSGSKWDKVLSNIITPHSRISFIDSQYGWLVNSSNDVGLVWRTEDGGSTWTLAGEIKAENPDEAFTSAVQIKFLDRNYGWLIEAFSIWRTHDGGKNWKQVLSLSEPQEDGQPTFGFFLNNLTAWVCGTKGKIYITSDGGRTWSTKSVDGASDLTGIFFTDPKNGWVLGRNSRTLYRTDDGGHTWDLLFTFDDQTRVESMHFSDEKEGRAVGRRLKRVISTPSAAPRSIWEGVILHTSDGGRSWVPDQILGESFPLNGIFFSDSQDSWLIADRGIYSNKGGSGWRLSLNLSNTKCEL